MTPPAARMRPLCESEAADAARRAAAAFGGTVDDEAVSRWRERIAAGSTWAWEQDGVALGQCRLLDTTHWFGGRRVGCLDMASVAVAPEHRGRGVARALMTAAVQHGAAQGLGLSLLYPATTRLYRSLGWEQAGIRSRYRVNARHVPAGGPAMRLGTQPTDWPAIRDCYELVASRMNGPSVRGDDRWDELRSSAYHYVLDVPGSPGRLDAYALINHHREPGDWQYTLAIADWVAASPRGLAAVVGLIGSHGTLGKDATYLAPVPSPWALLLPEQDDQVEAMFAWMARGLDPTVAIAERGFPTSLAASVTLRIDDPLLAFACGPWRLDIADGRGELRPYPGADVRLDARAFGPLFTGFRTPRELALAGLVHGPEESLEILGAVFAGPAPFLFDFF